MKVKLGIIKKKEGKSVGYFFLYNLENFFFSVTRT